MSSGADIVKLIGAPFTGASVLTASARHYHIGGDWNLSAALQNVLGGGVAGGLNLDLENCLLENSWVNFWELRNTPSCSLKMQNCTQRGGGDWLRNANPYASWSVTVRDSAFDGTQIVTPYGNFSSEDCSYNAYLSGASRWPNEANDTTVSGGFNWQTGPYGTAYLPADSSLINAGDQSPFAIIVPTGNNSLAPLSSFTVDPTNQSPDTNPKVAIGYHYPTSLLTPVGVLITGNVPTDCPDIDDYGDGPIKTYDFADGSLVHWFVPYGAVNENWGRGLGIYNGSIYYTEVPFNGVGPTINDIHICNYAQDNPVNMDDPSGNDGDLLSLSVDEGISASLDSMEGVVDVGAQVEEEGAVMQAQATEITQTAGVEGESASAAEEEVAQTTLEEEGTSVRKLIDQAKKLKNLAKDINVIPMPRAIIPAICANITAYQVRNPIKGFELERCGKLRRNENRKIAEAEYWTNPLNRRPKLGESLDEYPFASSFQGGSGARVTPVPIWQNCVQGGIISGAYRIEKIKEGTPYTVVVIP